jgi:hypothetical protein
MSVVVSTSIRRHSLLPVARGSNAISEIPPPIAIADPPRARRVAFFDLSQLVQERFESAIGGTFPPSPLLKSLRAKPRPRFAWLASGVLACAAGVLVAARGFGALGGGALQSPLVSVVYGALVAALVFAIAKAIDARGEGRALPWAAGVYVFPTALVDARTPTLDVLPLLDLATVEGDVRARRVRLVFTNRRSFAFDLEEGADVARVVAEVEEARTRAKDLAANGDASAVALADPLFESPEAPPIDATDANASRARAPSWTRRAGWIAMAAGLIAGPLVHNARDAASDAEAFRHAQARDDVDGWRAYLASDGAHHAEVESTLLPHAEARARRAALLHDLDVASAQGTLAALDAFVSAHPDHQLDVELKDARHLVFTHALDRYKAIAKNDDAVAFVARLLAVAEARGPWLRVVVTKDPSPTLADADAAVDGSNKFAGLVSHPSPWLDPSDDDATRSTIFAAVRARFAEVFPAEILDVALTDSEADVANGPALIVHHHVDWSGDLVVAPGFPGILVGARFAFDAELVLPDGGAPRGLSTTIDEHPNATPTTRVDGAPPPEQAVYAAMTASAADAARADVIALLF